jgi:hypothetical protein
MSFTGKATYSAGATLPEVAEDVSDLITIASPHETPLLDALGESTRFARSTIHEWLEDSLVANSVAVTAVASSTLVTVDDVTLVRVGDQMRIDETAERVLVTAVNTGTGQITLTRGYGGSVTITLATGAIMTNLGNAALEGEDAAAPRFTSRVRRSNYTQIFSATCEVSGSELAVRQLGVRDELDYQKAQRVRELLRDLENSVINGRAPATNPQGSATVRRTMRGLTSFLEEDAFEPGVGDMLEESTLTEPVLNRALRSVWERSGANIDTIVVGGALKRAINAFVATNRRFFSVNESYKDAVSTYESDFGVCRVVLSRYVPTGTALLLDSSRIDVLPLAGRSFQYRPLATTGDREAGQVIGEYTLEVRDPRSMGMIKNLSQ